MFSWFFSSGLAKLWSSLTLLGSYKGKKCAFRVIQVKAIPSCISNKTGWWINCFLVYVSHSCAWIKLVWLTSFNKGEPPHRHTHANVGLHSEMSDKALRF
jgi:hypothetical protein